jgi:hypothetical protein
MQYFAGFILACATITFLSTSVCAGDVVEITSHSGYPGYNNSLERINLRVARLNSQLDPTRESIEIDRFFEKISSVLADNKIDGDWGLAFLDLPFIEIEVDIGGEKLHLRSSHIDLERSGDRLVTERGIKSVSAEERESILAQQGEPFLRHRIAFETILRLTLERARSEFDSRGTPPLESGSQSTPWWKLW